MSRLRAQQLAGSGEAGDSGRGATTASSVCIAPIDLRSREPVLAGPFTRRPGDTSAHQVGRSEPNHPARRDCHRFAGHRVASRARALLTYVEGAEARNLYLLLVVQPVDDGAENVLERRRAVVAVQTRITRQRIDQIAAGQRASLPAVRLIRRKVRPSRGEGGGP